MAIAKQGKGQLLITVAAMYEITNELEGRGFPVLDFKLVKDTDTVKLILGTPKKPSNPEEHNQLVKYIEDIIELKARKAGASRNLKITITPGILENTFTVYLWNSI